MNDSDKVPGRTERKRTDRARRRRLELRKRRKRIRRIRRMVVLALMAFLVLLLILLVSALTGRLRRTKKPAEQVASSSEETEEGHTIPASEVLHLSFPILSMDTEKEGTGIKRKLTVTEFRTILDELYKEHYILVDIYDLSDGKVEVPGGKKPLVLSQRGLNYDPDAPSQPLRMLPDAQGYLTNEYLDPKGNIQTNAVDVVPLVDKFIAEHPDFSYNHARGILALTGEPSILGYRPELLQIEEETTDIPMKNPDEEESAEEPEKVSGPVQGTSTPQKDTELEELKAILGKLKEENWHLACGGYQKISYASTEDLVRKDLEKWSAEIQPLIGNTDLLLLPFGADFGPWSGYPADDPRYQLFKEKGFRYFFVERENVRSFVQQTETYFRQGIHLIENEQQFVQVMKKKENNRAGSQKTKG